MGEAAATYGLEPEVGVFENPNSKVQNRPVRPTIFVGLGGTGLKVLARLRQRIEDRYGSADYWDHFAFLGIDSDSHALNEGGVWESKGVRLNPPDRLPIGMDANEVRTILDDLKNSHAHIGWWLSDDAANLSAHDFTTGAGQMRSAGRLLFISHISQIRKALLSRLRAVQSPEALERARGNGAAIGVTAPPADVVLVSSIAGGTGAGSFLDCAYLARYLQMTGEANIGDIRGMLLMPDVFMNRLENVQQQEIILANGYASLRELEYYSPKSKQLIRPFFTSSWGADWVRADLNRISDFPFNTCYLLSLDNGTQGTTDDNMYDMVADALAFSMGETQMAIDMRSCWSNAQASVYRGQMRYQQWATRAQGGFEQDPVPGQPLNKNYVSFERNWSTRFSSLGIASVTMKLSELRRLAAVRLLRRIVAYELGIVPSAKDEAANNQAAQLTAPLAGRRGFVAKETVDKLTAQGERVIASAKGVEAESGARALLQPLHMIASEMDKPQTKLEPALKIGRAALAQAESDVNAMAGALAEFPLVRIRWALEQATERLKRERQTVKASPLPPFALAVAGLDQWKDFDEDDGGYWFGIGERAMGIIRGRFRSSLTAQLNAGIERINEGGRAIYLDEAIRLIDGLARQAQQGVTYLGDWSKRSLDVMQDNLAGHFKDQHNRVLTAHLAATVNDVEKQRNLDQQIFAALGSKFKKPPAQEEALLREARQTALAALNKLWKRGPGEVPRTLLAAKKEDDRSHADATERLVAILAREVLRDLPQDQDVFKVLNDDERSLTNDILPGVASRANAYWRFNADSRYERTVEKTSLASAVVSDQSPPGAQSQVATFFKSQGVKFTPALPNDEGAPHGEIVMVREIHGLSIPSLQRLPELKQAYQAVTQRGMADDRHLDKRLRLDLPEIDPVQSAEAGELIGSWDDAFWGILIGLFRWDEHLGSYQYKVERNKWLPAGNSYQGIAQWLIQTKTTTNYRQKVNEQVVQFLQQMVREAFNGQDYAARTAAARHGAEAAIRLRLALVLLGEQVFPVDSNRGPHLFYPPDQTMIRRLILTLDQRLAVLRGKGEQWELLDLEAIEDAIWPELHRWVKFVGPHPQRDDFLSGMERETAKRKRILNVLDAPLEANDRSALNEAFELKWYADMDLHDAMELHTLFPDRKSPATPAAAPERLVPQAVEVPATPAPEGGAAADFGRRPEGTASWPAGASGRELVTAPDPAAATAQPAVGNSRVTEPVEVAPESDGADDVAPASASRFKV